MSVSIEWLGFAAITLSVLAYLPQITHLIKEHCSAGQEPWSVLHVGGIGGAAPHLFNREERPGFYIASELSSCSGVADLLLLSEVQGPTLRGTRRPTFVGQT